jgi:hypothetical protein
VGLVSKLLAAGAQIESRDEVSELGSLFQQLTVSSKEGLPSIMLAFEVIWRWWMFFYPLGLQLKFKLR